MVVVVVVVVVEGVSSLVELERVFLGVGGRGRGRGRVGGASEKLDDLFEGGSVCLDESGGGRLRIRSGNGGRRRRKGRRRRVLWVMRFGTCFH